MASSCHTDKKLAHKARIMDKKLAHKARINLFLPAHFNPDDFISQKRYN